MRLLYLALDFGWPAVRGGQVRVLSQLGVLSSLPEVERIRVFWLSEDRASFTARAGLAREMPKLDVLDPIFHPIHLFQHPRYVPRVAWLRIVHGGPYLSGEWESPLVRSAIERELRRPRFDVVWVGGPRAARRACYVGPLTWHRNVRGLDWFCGQVWPHVRDLLPTATLEIAGSGLEDGSRAAPLVPSAWRAPGITVLGLVPELGPLYERSALMVAPVLGGFGVRMKLLEAFRNGVPVVPTPHA